VLHLSDLRVGDESVSLASGYPQLLNDFIAEIERHSGTRAFNYIIVSGNLTAHGQPDEFRRAGRLLKNIYDRVARNGGERGFANRVFFVPGPQDLTSSDNPFAPVNTFVADTFGIDHAFAFNRSLVRQLKDVTLIGLVYWNQPTTGPGGSLESLHAAARDAEDKVAHKLYALKTPTLLVSAEPPLLGAANYGRSDMFRTLCGWFNENHRISLHLFGKSVISCHGPEPFGFHHFGLGTGSLNQHAPPWPLHANCIKLATDLTGNDAAGDSKAEIICLRRNRPDDEWNKEVYIRGELDRLLSRGLDFGTPVELFGELFRKLGRDIFDEKGGAVGRLIRLRGLPGSGKRHLYDALRQAASLGPNPVQVLAEILGDELGDKKASARLRAIRNIEQRLRKIKDGAGNVVILLYDKTGSRQLRSSLSDSKSLNIIAQADELLAQITNHNRVAARIEITTDTDHAASYTEAPFREHYIGPPHVLDDRGREAILRPFMYRVPLNPNDLLRLTGSFIGLQAILLHNIEESFARRDGATPLPAAIDSEIAFDAALQVSAGREALSLINRVRERYAGAGSAICFHIRDAVRSKYGAVRTEILDGPVLVDFGPLIRASSEASNHLEVLGWLCDSGVLAHVDRTSHQYDLLLLAPFLWFAKATEYEVFLSFSITHWGSYASQFAEELRVHAPPGAYVRVYCCTEPNKIEAHGRIMPEIKEALVRSENLMVLFDTAGFEDSTYVPNEIMIWRERWDAEAQSRRARMTGLRFGSGERPVPKIFDDHKVRSVLERDAKSLAKHVWNEQRLVPKRSFGTSEEAAK
jgi:hypothetical protein